MSDLKIRRMEAADLPAVVGVMEAVLNESAEQRWHSTLKHYLQNPPEGCLIARKEGPTVGFIVGEIKI